MTTSDARPRSPSQDTRLNATLMSGDRLYPITVTASSNAGATTRPRSFHGTGGRTSRVSQNPTSDAKAIAVPLPTATAVAFTRKGGILEKTRTLSFGKHIEWGSSRSSRLDPMIG